MHEGKMSKYANLSKHLTDLRVSRWEATFEEIEHILGFQLPQRAYKYQAWWANQVGSGHSQTMGWTGAGWKTEELNLQKQRVTFIRSGENEGLATSFVASKPPTASMSLTIAEAKTGLASHFNVTPEMIEITIKG
jgi:hypothetical protein